MQRFVENIEKTITNTPGVLSSNIQKQFGPDSETVYLKGNLIFIDSSVLEIAIFANNVLDTVAIDKYRFHYMGKNGQMIFRYDNAPHHHKITSFPHHKHTTNEVIHTTMPSLKDVLNEISAFIIGK